MDLSRFDPGVTVDALLALPPERLRYLATVNDEDYYAAAVVLRRNGATTIYCPLDEWELRPAGQVALRERTIAEMAARLAELEPRARLAAEYEQKLARLTDAALAATATAGDEIAQLQRERAALQARHTTALEDAAREVSAQADRIAQLEAQLRRRRAPDAAAPAAYPCRYPGCGEVYARSQARGRHEQAAHGAVWREPPADGEPTYVCAVCGVEKAESQYDHKQLPSGTITRASSICTDCRRKRDRVAAPVAPCPHCGQQFETASARGGHLAHCNRRAEVRKAAGLPTREEARDAAPLA